MAIIINDELKENFEKFCNKNFPKKSFESNKSLVKTGFMFK